MQQGQNPSEYFFARRKITIRKNVTDGIFYVLFTKTDLTVYFLLYSFLPQTSLAK